MSGHSLGEEVRGNSKRQGHGHLLRGDAPLRYVAAVLRLCRDIAYFVFFLFVMLAYIVSLAYAKAPGLIEIEGRCFIFGGGRRLSPVAKSQACSVVSSPCLIISSLFLSFNN